MGCSRIKMSFLAALFLLILLYLLWMYMVPHPGTFRILESSLGDELYGSGTPYHLQGQALHAMELGFPHPETGEEMLFIAPLPEYFEELLEKLRRHEKGRNS